MYISGWVESVMGCLAYDKKNTTTYLNGLIRYCRIQGGVSLTILNWKMHTQVCGKC